MTDSPNQARSAVFGVLIAIVLIFLAIIANRIFFGIDAKHYNASWFFLSRIYIWIALALVFLYATKVERQPLLLWKNKKYSFGKSILFALSIVLLCMLFGGIAGLTLKHFGIKIESAKTGAIWRLFKSNIPLLLFTCLTAGITEELLIRGYILSRLNQLLKSPVAAIIFSSLVFALFHFGWGSWFEIIAPLLIGLIYATFYWKYRNIKILIIVHFLWDFIAMLIHIK